MDGSFDAVKHFKVQFRQLVLGVSTGFLDITKTGSIDNVTDNESLNGLVLGDGFSSGNATHTFDVSAAVLVASVIAAFDSHDDIYKYIKKRMKAC
jgi:hypothetical protein